jgi:uncharacterized membrane protein
LTLESNKTLGGVGAILLAIPFLNLIGIILLLVAMKGVADDYNTPDIFKNALYGFIFGVVGVIALVAAILIFFFGVAVLTPYPSPPYTSPSTVPLAGLGLIVLVVVIMYVFALVSAIFYNKALGILAAKSGEGIFNTGGMLLLIGAIIPVIGVLLQFVAWILVAVGFFNIRPSTQVFVPTPPAPTQAVPTTQANRFCQHCGAPIPPDATYCTKCGKKIA